MESAVRLDKIEQILIYVSDLEASETFYREKLGMDEVLMRLPHAVFLRCGEINLLLDQVHLPPVQPALMPEIYFRVEDIHGAYESLKGRGVRFHSEPGSIGYSRGEEVWLAGFSDPDSQRFYLICNFPQEQLAAA